MHDRWISLYFSFCAEPFPPQDILFADDAFHYFFNGFVACLYARRVRTPDVRKITLSDAKGPELGQAWAAKDVSTRKENAMHSFERGEAYGASV